MDLLPIVIAIGEREGLSPSRTAHSLERLMPTDRVDGLRPDICRRASSHEDDQRGSRVSPDQVSEELIDRVLKCLLSLPHLAFSDEHSALVAAVGDEDVGLAADRLNVSPVAGPKWLLSTTSSTSRKDSSGILANVFGRRCTAVVTLSISRRIAAKPSSEIAGSGAKKGFRAIGCTATGRTLRGGSTVNDGDGFARSTTGTSRKASSARSAITLVRRSSTHRRSSTRSRSFQGSMSFRDQPTYLRMVSSIESTYDFTAFGSSGAPPLVGDQDEAVAKLESRRVHGARAGTYVEQNSIALERIEEPDARTRHLDALALPTSHIEVDVFRARR